MEKNKKRNLSPTDRYRDMSEYWDTHDLSDQWEKGKDVHFDVEIVGEVTYCALDRDLSERIQEIARRHGVSSDTMVNMWIQDRLLEETAEKR